MAGEGGDANTLIKVAVFCLTFSIISTAMVTWYIQGSGDYDYDTLGAFKSQLVEYSGGQLVNDSPWVLTSVYTPFIPSQVADEDIPDHIEYDNGRGGWLFGEKIENYPDLGKAVGIHLDKNYKSNQLLTVGDPTYYTYANGKEWWAGGNPFGVDLSGIGRDIIQFFGNTPGDDYGVKYSTGSANNWNYSGYRYCFDPTLPFSNGASSKDGRLSLVWYEIPDDTGLSGALEVYGANGSQEVLLGRYSAYDIVQAFQSSLGYVKVFDFDFDGVHINLTIRFNPTVYGSYSSLIEAWNDGAWDLAISSASAGNFFDVENSNSFASSAGQMFDTFVKIYTFQTPQFENDPAVNTIVWLLVGLPMTVALLFVTLRVVGGVFKIF